MKKQLGVAALGLAGLTAGAGAGLVLTGGSGGAAAQTSPTTPDTSAPTTEAPDSSGQDGEHKDPGTWLQDALAPLVEKGTITQAQADAVIAAIQDARPERGGGPGRGGPGHDGFGHGGFGHGGFGHVGLDAAAEALGLSTDELVTQLRDGKTIAQVAETQKVDLDAVKKAMLDAFRTGQQEAVTSGRLTQAQADANTAAFEDRLDDLVSNTLPTRPDEDGTPPSTTTG